MPGGPSVVGLAYFAAIKLAGYSAAGRYLNEKYETDRPKPLTFGLFRTALGLAVGAFYVFGMSQVEVNRGDTLWFVLLIPARFAEWSLTIWLFHQRRKPLPRYPWYVMFGIAWSFVLDLPAILAVFVLPGGVWIC